MNEVETTLPPEADARRRVVIANVEPEVDGGRYAVKRVAGDTIVIEADIYADGHDELACRVYYRCEGAAAWQELPMTARYNDRWRAEFGAGAPGTYVYRLEAWVDRFATWQRDLAKRLDAGQDLAIELQAGAEMIASAAERATGEDGEKLRQRAYALGRDWSDEVRASLALEEPLTALMQGYGERDPVTSYDVAQRIVVDRERANFSSWYEIFPRSTSPVPGKHGTFRNVIAWLPYINRMGFDVVYLPPIHPIGRSHRKGPNNNPVGTPGDLGSPWAIGSEEGGHKSVNPELGTLADFADLVQAARDRDMEIALDIAFQCSPDHPYVREHPEWFRRRPDGSIRYAENPPKKYEDIYPLNFETQDWRALWQELCSVVCFWADQGVRIFRVDNPHTKPYAFWEWLIAEVRGDYPDVLFLAEAFTRPRVMEHLAKIGFSQSYTYFTWRNHSWDLAAYMQELTQTKVREYFRPNLWPNTPDILHEFLQTGGRPSFFIRLALAATLSSSYGIYGPAFELCESLPREPGSEEYLDSEKYQLRHWEVNAEHSLKDLIARINRIRRDNPALQRNDTLKFFETSNDQIIAYSKSSPDGGNLIVCVVNLDPHNTQAGTVRVPLWQLGLSYDETYEMHDLLDDARYIWDQEWNYVQLNPQVSPAHIFSLRQGHSRLQT